MIIDEDLPPSGERWKRTLKKALDTSSRWEKKDECGDWNLFGRSGKIFLDDNNWYVYTTNTKSWKILVDFMILIQYGDYEKIFKLNRLPTFRESQKVRKSSRF